MNPARKAPRMTPRRRELWLRSGALATTRGPVVAKKPHRAHWHTITDGIAVEANYQYRGSTRGRASSRREVMEVTEKDEIKASRSGRGTIVTYRVLDGPLAGKIRTTSLAEFKRWADEVWA